MASLTRPEGPLFVASCALWLLASQARVRTGRRLPPWRSLSWLLGPCLAIIAAHYLWRYSYYGEWLPNTYYAKHVRPWYSMGLRYLALAALETGLPILLALGAVAFVSRWRRRRCIAYILPFLALVLHMGYLARIGGDHFEFRPLDFYWPLLALPASEGLVLIALRLARLLRRPGPRAVRRTSVVLFFVLLLYANVQQAAIVVAPDHFKHAYPTGWAIFPIIDEENAPWLQRVPGMPLILLLANYLRIQTISQSVALRAESHRAGFENFMPRWAPYDGLPPDFLPPDAVMARHAVGIAPYHLPSLTIVDLWGLVDPVVARYPPDLPDASRRLAHDRRPPPGYLAARGVNITILSPRGSPRLRSRAPRGATPCVPARGCGCPSTHPIMRGCSSGSPAASCTLLLPFSHADNPARSRPSRGCATGMRSFAVMGPSPLLPAGSTPCRRRPPPPPPGRSRGGPRPPTPAPPHDRYSRRLA